ncbi:hypothetical protein ABZ330_17215 [Streptomyces sp. NPDC006172]|uniref:hypothetical protein n=1 Tax=Streptomyces sp. NPDC006172 TaxID=3154470 RepID=UPI0033EB9FBD
MDHFERELAQLMRDSHEYVPFEPRHRDRLRSGVRARRRTRMAQRTVGCALVVAGFGLGFLLLPRDDPAENRPQAPQPRPVSSPVSPSVTPTRTSKASPSESPSSLPDERATAGGPASASRTAPPGGGPGTRAPDATSPATTLPSSTGSSLTPPPASATASAGFDDR